MNPCFLFLVIVFISFQFANSQQIAERPKLNLRTDPYLNSNILSFRSAHTIVPKGSLIIVPESLKDRIGHNRGVFTIWPKFSRNNMAWIHKFEVTLNQAMGKSAIDKKKLEGLTKLNKIVVAVYHGNPVSMMPVNISKVQAKINN